jgi:hypothetical protein
VPADEAQYYGMTHTQRRRLLERSERSSGRSRWWLSALLWVVAVTVMAGSAVHQRLTGPTHPMRGEIVVGDAPVAYRLVRSATTTGDARVQVPAPVPELSGFLVYRRYPTAESWRQEPLVREGDVLVGHLPRQPAAGKMEYYLELHGPGEQVRIPASAEDDPVLRYKDPVPAVALVPHVLLMFLAILVGIRAGLGAMVGTPDARRLAWTALGLMTVGGMVLGPIVQKYAFGAFWTGFPLGYDLTDNKTLVMWLAWLAACAVLGFGARGRTPRRARAGRAAVAAAAVVMLVVYLIPHSMRGSELDYERLDRGVDPAEAVRTG